MKKCTCINCGNPATCEHHVVPIVLGGLDIPSNKVPLCDKCHGIVHSVIFGSGSMSHSELVKRGIQRKKEAIAKGEIYQPRKRGGGGNCIGRPKTTFNDIPQTFITIYQSKEYKSISDLARRVSMSRTTVYKYITMIENN
jgi:Mor family transcriptional regulator